MKKAADGVHFADLVQSALDNLWHELCQGYLLSVADHLAENRRLRDELAALRAEVATVRDEEAPAEEGSAFEQPLPAARVALLARGSQRLEGGPPASAKAQLFWTLDRCDSAADDAWQSGRRTALPEEGPQLGSLSMTPEELSQGAEASPASPASSSSTTASAARSWTVAPWAETQMYPEETVSPRGAAADEEVHLAVHPHEGPGSSDALAYRSDSHQSQTLLISRMGEFDSDHAAMVSRNATSRTQGSVNLRQRLQARLAALRSKYFVHGRELYRVLSGLGLEKYTVKDMEDLVHHVGVAIRLRLRDEGDSKATAPLSPRSYLHRHQGGVEELPRATWHWPCASEYDSSMTLTPFGMVRRLSMNSFSSGSASASEEADHSAAVIPWQALIEMFLQDEAYLERLLGTSLTDQVCTMREVLLAGEAHRIISELTFVKIDDLAAGSRRGEAIPVTSAVIGTMILLNGLSVGMQADPRLHNWQHWPWVELCFTCFFLVEALLCYHAQGRHKYLCGPERAWHIFELVLVSFGLADSIGTFVSHSALPLHELFRFLRFARLLQLVRVFRFRFMLELRLIVKGILSGMRTLFWAFVLLLFVLYALGVGTAMLFGGTNEVAVQELFKDVPTSMFTTFRCISGDCFTRNGSSLSVSLYMEYGPLFAVGFVAAYMLISLGLFNMILAIYVDITMVAAKQTDDANKGRHERECIRVAMLTKKLLQMFCAAHQYYRMLHASEREHSNIHEVLMNANAYDIEMEDDIAISKELYLLVTEDAAVQQVLDELDIPPDRASLFDCFDADGSGRLQAAELVRGFLKVRGEIKKADHVACILALRHMQTTLKQMRDESEQYRRTLERVQDTCTKVDSRKGSLWIRAISAP